MNFLNNRDKQDGIGCADVRAALSEYTDNTLSAQRTWRVEKHLTGCAACALEARRIQATVQLLRDTPRLDTSDTFMASLHARLDTVDPTIVGERSWQHRLSAWFSGSNNSFEGNRAPLLSLGFAAGMLALLMVVNRPVEPVIATSPTSATSDSVHVTLATSANSPFSDPAADNLEFRSAGHSGRPAISF